MADVIQFWEMQMSTHRTGKYKHDHDHFTNISICYNSLFVIDDTILFRKTKEIGDKQKLQDDIDKIVRWSEKKADVIQFWEM